MNVAPAYILLLAGQRPGATIEMQVTPLVGDTSYPIVKQFHADAVTYNVQLDPGSLEGYLNAAALVEGLKKAGPNLTRDSVRDAFETFSNVDIGGIKISYSKTDHQGLKQIFMSQVRDGKIVPLRN